MIKSRIIKLLKSSMEKIMLSSFSRSINRIDIYSSDNKDKFYKKYKKFWICSFDHEINSQILFDKKVFICLRVDNGIKLYVQESEFKKIVTDYIDKNIAIKKSSSFYLNFYNTYIERVLDLTLDYERRLKEEPDFINMYNISLYGFSSGLKRYLEEENTLSAYSYIPLS